MMTENLQDMVSDINENDANAMSEYDIILRHSAKPKEIPDASQKESSPVQELQAMGRSEPSESEIPSIGTIEMPEAELVNEYHPESEEALIDYVNTQNSKLEMANILVKWEIGRCINSFYQGKYGTNELGKISIATGIGKDTLVKACKFAKQYPKEHVDMLLRGNFVMSWYQIAKHLTIEPQKVIKTYQQSQDHEQFNYDIIKLKSPSETRGKSKPAKIVEAKALKAPIMVDAEIIPQDGTIVECHEQNVIADSNEQAQYYGDYEKELAMLKLENEQLKKESSDKDQQINSLNSMVEEDSRDIMDRDLIIAAYRDRFKRLRSMIENNFSVGTIMELLVAVE